MEARGRQGVRIDANVEVNCGRLEGRERVYPSMQFHASTFPALCAHLLTGRYCCHRSHHDPTTPSSLPISSLSSSSEQTQHNLMARSRILSRALASCTTSMAKRPWDMAIALLTPPSTSKTTCAKTAMLSAVSSSIDVLKG